MDLRQETTRERKKVVIFVETTMLSVTTRRKGEKAMFFLSGELPVCYNRSDRGPLGASGGTPRPPEDDRGAPGDARASFAFLLIGLRHATRCPPFRTPPRAPLRGRAKPAKVLLRNENIPVSISRRA